VGFGVVMLVLTVGAVDAGAGAPTDALKDFFGAVNVVLRDPRTADQPLEKLRAIRRHVDDVVDFREAAMLALGREWTARTPVEQNEFVALFADLLERSFVWRVAGKASLGGGVRVDYLNETANGDTAAVETAVGGRDGNDFGLEFRMVRRAERWVVRDIVMDGVSTMENYHAQFQRIVRDVSWRGLVTQLRAKIGAPAGGVQVAAAAPVAAPPPPPLEPVVAPLPPPDLDRPGGDVPHAIAREVAAAVTPAPRDTTRPVAQRAPVAPPRLAAVVPPPSPLHRESDTFPFVTPSARRPPPGETRGAPTPLRGSDGGSPVARPVNRGEEQRGASPAPSLWIQVGAFKSASTAGRVAEQVQGEILVVAAPAPSGARAEPLLRVRVGPFPDRAHAAARLRQIRALGYRPFIAAGD
jgi:ABC-type transporter MlaC component